jgi:hypothetical protein
MDQGGIEHRLMRPTPPWKGKDVDMNIFSARAPDKQRCARALNNLNKAVEQAIRSTGHAYKFAPNSYTVGALGDAMALGSHMALLAGRTAAIAEDDS